MTVEFHLINMCDEKCIPLADVRDKRRALVKKVRNDPVVP